MARGKCFSRFAIGRRADTAVVGNFRSRIAPPGERRPAAPAAKNQSYAMTFTGDLYSLLTFALAAAKRTYRNRREWCSETPVFFWSFDR